MKQREIKFRAWDKKYKHWLWVDDDEICNGYLEDNAKDATWHITTGKNVILLQYTGLKDKNGKEIYEGDVINWFYGAKNPASKEPVVFNKGSFCFEIDGFFYPIAEYIHQDGFEVIGNIYENSELLT